jgi:hypothetical protein
MGCEDTNFIEIGLRINFNEKANRYLPHDFHCIILKQIKKTQPGGFTSANSNFEN